MIFYVASTQGEETLTPVEMYHKFMQKDIAINLAGTNFTQKRVEFKKIPRYFSLFGHKKPNDIIYFQYLLV